MGYNEIRTNDDGTLDEVVLENVSAHLEQMSNKSWWLGLTKPHGTTLHVSFYIEKVGRKRRLVAFIQEDEIGLPVVPPSAPPQP